MYGVGEDPVEPGLEVGPQLEGARTPVRLQIGLLHEVLGIGRHSASSGARPCRGRACTPLTRSETPPDRPCSPTQPGNVCHHGSVYRRPRQGMMGTVNDRPLLGHSLFRTGGLRTDGELRPVVLSSAWHQGDRVSKVLRAGRLGVSPSPSPAGHGRPHAAQPGGRSPVDLRRRRRATALGQWPHPAWHAAGAPPTAPHSGGVIRRADSRSGGSGLRPVSDPVFNRPADRPPTRRRVGPLPACRPPHRPPRTVERQGRVAGTARPPLAPSSEYGRAEGGDGGGGGATTRRTPQPPEDENPFALVVGGCGPPSSRR